MHWSNQPALGALIVSKVLSLHRFPQIKSGFHLVDHCTLTNSIHKMVKVYNSLNVAFIRFGNEIWSICSANGYPYSLVKLHRRNEILLSNKTESKMMNIITEYSEPRKHEFYFDRL